MALLINATNDTFATSENQSQHLRPDVKFSVYEYALMAITGFIIMINGYILSLFIRKATLRRNSSLLLLSLTLADLFTGIVTVPLIIASTPLRMLDFEAYKLVFIFGDITAVISAALTISNLCAVTADRYIRLCYPIKHMILVRKKTVVTMICAIWIIAISYSFVPFIWLHEILEANPSEETYMRIDRLDTRYTIASAIICAIPICGLTIAFARMFYAIHTLGIHEQQLSADATLKRLRRRRERKAIILFSLMFVLFMICWVPWILLRPFATEKVFDKIPPQILNTIMIIRFLTSILNPLLYTLHEHDFHRALIGDIETVVPCRKCSNGRHKGASYGNDSLHKLTVLRPGRKGTDTFTLKSQENTENEASFVPSPIIVHSGHSSSTSRNDRTVIGPYENAVDGETSGSHAKYKSYINETSDQLKTSNGPPVKANVFKNEINAVLLNERKKEDKIKRLGPRHKDFTNANDYIDGGSHTDTEHRTTGTLFYGGKHCKGNGDMRSRFTYTFDEYPVFDDVGDFMTENDTVNSRQKESDAFLNNESRKTGKKEQTVKLLKTSFIGRLFEAEDLKSCKT